MNYLKLFSCLSIFLIFFTLIIIYFNINYFSLEILSTIFFLSTILTLSMSQNLQCSYEYFTWTVVGSIYQCDVQNDLNIILSESSIITEATRSHDGSNNNNDVIGIHTKDRKVEFFPRGLEKIFKNLKLISINNGFIKEVHQKNLKPFFNSWNILDCPIIASKFLRMDFSTSIQS